MARYRTRSPQDASKKSPGKISIKRKPRHPDNVLYAISHIHLVEHHGQRQYFPIREVYETAKHLHAERNDEVTLGKYLERAIHTHILKTFVNAGYLEFDDLKTHIRVTPAGSAFLQDVAEKVRATEYDSKVIEHRAHCDYFRQQVGPLAKLTTKELSDEVEDLQEKVEEYERHQRTCPTFTSSQPFQRASSAATELSSDAGGFDDMPHLRTPDSSMDPQAQETEDGRNADAEMLPPAELFSQSFSTPAPASRRPIQSTPFNNPYMTPETISRSRPQRTITQATITPPPSPPYGNRRSLTPQAPATEHMEDIDMTLDDYADPDTTLVHSPGEGDYQELSTLREENKAYKNWTYKMADLVKPWWGDKIFNPSDINEISNSACRVVSNLQFAEADILEKDKQLQSLQNDLVWTKVASDAQIESLQIAVRDAENELIAYQLERKQDHAEIQDLKDTLVNTKEMLANAIKERDEAVEQIRSIFMGAGKFLNIPTEEPISISADPVLRTA